MAMLCFVLDLRTLSSSTVRALKRSLLQLANFCAVSDSTGYISRSRTLGDRIGLGYIIRDQHSCSDELKVAYEPCEKFNLRKFHHAVDCLPTNAMLPKINDSEALFSSDMMLASFLSGKVLYKWGGYEKGIAKKAILISSRVPEYLDSVKKDILMEAAEKSVSVEFLLSEPKSSLLGDLSETINTFVKQISDLDNCSFRTFLPDPQVLCGLVKGWLQDLKNDIEPLQARFTFKSNIFETVNCISCTLSASATPLVDGFDPCQACRCHGVPLDEVLDNKIQQFSSCPVTGHDLEPHNLVEKCLKVGEHTVLLLPSFGNYEKLQVVSQPVDLNVIERTSVGSLSEGYFEGSKCSVFVIL